MLTFCYFSLIVARLISLYKIIEYLWFTIHQSAQPDAPISGSPPSYQRGSSFLWVMVAAPMIDASRSYERSLSLLSAIPIIPISVDWAAAITGTLWSASPEGGDEASHPPSSPWVSGHQDHSGSPWFAGHAESLSLLRCHEASASAGFIASSIKIQVLPISMVLLPALIGRFFVLKDKIALLSLTVFRAR